MANRLWMYQLNPKRGEFRDGVPTTAENLHNIVRAGRTATWYVTKNHLQARVDDPVLVKVSGGKVGEPSGIVAFATIEKIRTSVPNITLSFDRAVTDALMANPISLKNLREQLAPERNNLVNLAEATTWARHQILRRIAPTAVLPFDPDRAGIVLPPFVCGRHYPADWKAEPKHRPLVDRLVQHLRSEGWSDFEEGLSSFDLRASKGDVRKLFAVAAESPDWAETALLLLELFEWRRDDKGNPALCVATGSRFSAAALGTLSAAGVEVLRLPARDAVPPTRRGLGADPARPAGRPPRIPTGVRITGKLRGGSRNEGRKLVGSGARHVDVAVDLKRTGRVRHWKLPAGQLMLSQDPGVQHGLLVQDVSIDLSDEDKLILAMYCANQSRASASSDTHFELGPVVDDPSLRELFDLVGDRELTGHEDLIQKAVWEITDTTVGLSLPTRAELAALRPR